MPLASENRSITTMRLPADLLRDLTRIAIQRGVSRTKLVEWEMRALVKRQAEIDDDENPFA